MATNGGLKDSRLALSAASTLSSSDSGKPPMPPQTVTFGRRTLSGRYISYSRDDLDSEIGSVEFANYHVDIPPTPDNQPMDDEVPVDPPISARVEEQYVSSSLFTGGFNSVTRAHFMEKVMETDANYPQMAGAKGFDNYTKGCAFSATLGDTRTRHL